MSQLNFNSSEVEPVSTDFEPIPKGIYEAEITASEVTAASSGNGDILKLQDTIITGDYEKRVLFINLNIKHTNPKAEQIGRGLLSALCRAVGKLGLVKDSSELHGRKHLIKVDIEPGNNGYGPKNVVKAFYALDKKAKTEAAPQKVEQTKIEDDQLPF